MTQLAIDNVRTINKSWQKPRSSTSIDSHVGLRMRLRRIEIGMTQDTLASMLGITAQQVQKYERGANRIGSGRLLQIATILDVQVGYFFSGLDLAEIDGSGEVASPLATALEDAATVRLLRMFASIEDPKLRLRVLGLVEAVVATEA